MYSLQVKSPWGSVKQNKDLVDVRSFTRALLDKGIAFSIESVACKGAMSNRYLEMNLGFFSVGDLSIAADAYDACPKLARDP